MRVTREFAVASTSINKDQYRYVPKKKLKKALKDDKRDRRQQEATRRLNNKFSKKSK